MRLHAAGVRRKQKRLHNMTGSARQAGGGGTPTQPHAAASTPQAGRALLLRWTAAKAEGTNLGLLAAAYIFSVVFAPLDAVFLLRTFRVRR